MNYRAKMIGASLDIRRGAGGGTIVLCSFHNERVPGTDARPAPRAEPLPSPKPTLLGSAS